MENWRNIIRKITEEQELERRAAERIDRRQTNRSVEIRAAELERRRKAQEAEELLRKFYAAELLKKMKREVWNGEGEIVKLTSVPGYRLLYEYRTSVQSRRQASAGGYDGPSDFELITLRGLGYSFTEIRIDLADHTLDIADGEIVGFPEIGSDAWKRWKSFKYGEDILAYAIPSLKSNIHGSSLSLDLHTSTDLGSALLGLSIKRAHEQRMPSNFRALR